MTQTATRKRHFSTDSTSGEYWYDENAATDAANFFKSFLHHVKGDSAGSPFVLLPWQENEVIRPAFGWKRRDGSRKYRRVYVEIPRKNGKSTMCAGIALKLTFADGEPGAEVYSAAADRDQAAIVFDVARTMVEEAPELAQQSQSYRRSIVVPSTRCSYKVLSADAYSKHGLNAHGIIFDELHAQPNRELWDVLTTSTGARRQALIVTITTAGFDRHSICWELHDYALKVRDGIINDPTFLPVIYAAPDDADWTDPKVWRAANPSLGVTISEEYLAQECQRAQDSPAYQNTFRRLHLNQWTEQESRWIDMATYDESEGHPIDLETYKGKRCFAGLDLSTTTDLTARALLFRCLEKDGAYDCVMQFWVPEEAIEKRAQRDRVPYPQWEREGWIEATSGNVVDYEVIRQHLLNTAKEHQVEEIGYDPWNATQLATQLSEEGATCVPVRQSIASLTEACKELEKLILAKKFHHGGNPVLRWNFSNVVVIQDSSGNIKPAKNKSTERIDGCVAVIVALSCAIRHEGDGTSIYEQRGVLIL